MSSSIEAKPVPLKRKLSQVKNLLDNADKRLQDECKIFTTNTSASSNPTSIQQNGSNQGTMLKNDLIRTISDISTLKSVLSCPIFNSIVNVTDSLDELSYQLNLHPSISPTDINIDANGELILAPPIERTSLNNIINSKLDEFTDQSNDSPQIMSMDVVHNNHQILDHDQYQNQPMSPHRLDQIDCDGRFLQDQNITNLNHQQQDQHEPARHVPQHQSYLTSNNMSSPTCPNDSEKLVSVSYQQTFFNGNNNAKSQIHREIKNRMAINGDGENLRLFKSDGTFSHEQNGLNSTQQLLHSDISIEQSAIVASHNGSNGYSNEMYNITQEFVHPEVMMIAERPDHNLQSQLKSQMNGMTNSSPVRSLQNQGHISTTKITNATTNTTTNNTASSGPKVQSAQSSGVHYNRGSCSPSSSAGSTIRLADECDSGASSYQSHVIKGGNTASFTSYPNQKSTNQASTVTQIPKEVHVENMEQGLIENLTPDMERIHVTLEKDGHGLGITIAGYTCEEEEISGIFIKSITPNSPADRSGKIRTLDQIFAVDGRELLGYSNPEAVNVLRNTGKVVTLELMRYLAESKYQKLQTVLANAVPTLNSRLSSHTEPKKNDFQSSSSPTKSCIPVSTTRENNQSSVKQSLMSPSVSNSTFVEVSNVLQSSFTGCSKETESIYKNDSVTKSNGVEEQDTPNAKYSTIDHTLNRNSVPSHYTDQKSSHVPVAAQRGSNKVINVKQGARNTIDIRSPICQTSTTATYINSKETGLELLESTNKKLLENTSYEFDRLPRSEEPEWEKDAQIIELLKDTSQSLGFRVKEYANPKDPKQSIIMIISLNPGGIAERDGRLSVGDLLIFVDDTNLEGATLAETVRALKKTNGQVRLGVLKVKR